MEKVHDIVGLYLNPPEIVVVYLVDEKSQVQALARSQPAFPMMPGLPEKRTHHYVRHGTTMLFAGMNVADGTVIGTTYRSHRSSEFKKFLALIDDQAPDGLDVHVICDNYGTQAPRACRPGSLAIPDSRCTSPRPTPPGSTRSNTLRPRHRRPTTPQRPPLRPGPRGRPTRLGQDLERGPQTIRLDQDRRPDPRIPRPTNPANLRRRTLALQLWRV